MLPDKIRFGPAGYPAEARGNVKKVFKILTEARVDAFEYAAVYGLRAKEERAKLIGDLAREANISMSMHAAYYISLASVTPRIRKASKQRLVKALKFAPLMNVKRIVFHAGTHANRSEEETHIIIRDALREVWDRAGDLGKGAYLAPEIAGKLSAYGSEDQLIKLCQDVEGCIPTIDWAHLYARSQGKVNDKSSYLRVITQFEDGLGDLFVKNMHFHVSGITFTDKGEAAHRPLGQKWGPDILPLMEIVRECGYKPTFICESTNPLEGALYTKFLYEELEKVSK
ncbi:MAG: TIM barrel protein [Candidatus Thorarchaeota archaeon]|jgi:deoxyribonuclease-4